jgi:methyltransferase
VVFLDRPFIPTLAMAMALVFVATNGVRWWVIRTLAGRWSVRVLTPSLGIVASGPFRHVRHPNYAAVFVEMMAIPLVHSAWLTALVGAVIHVFVLRARIALEESVLLANPEYAAAMSGKPRFVPWLF